MGAEGERAELSRAVETSAVELVRSALNAAGEACICFVLSSEGGRLDSLPASRSGVGGASRGTASAGAEQEHVVTVQGREEPRMQTADLRSYPARAETVFSRRRRAPEPRSRRDAARPCRRTRRR